MDKRTTFSSVLKKKKATLNSSQMVTTGLDPYEGPWDFAKAAHLLRRATFAPTKAMIQQSLDQGLDATIVELFTALPMPDPPVYHDTADDPYAGLGETWINSPLSADTNFNGNRLRSLRSWTTRLINEEGISIREKLCLFWVNHFAIQGVNDRRVFYEYSTLIRSHASGNVRQLVKEMTINHAMLRFLNGNVNRVGSPNENYAREVLELYTIGKGPVAGPGDYTNYTEQDVTELARAFTGWRTRGYNTENPEIIPESYYQSNRHDTGDKELSNRFDNEVITDMAENEYSYVIDLIFGKDEVARHICRKLYRWFIYYKIDDATEEMVIEPLAQLLIDNDYEIQPVLETLLRSEHFFDILSVGPMIKHPLEFVMGIVKTAQVSLPDDWQEVSFVYDNIYIRTRNIGQDYQHVPQVAGWKAYYQQPLYYRNWINSTSLQLRNEVANRLSTNGYFTNGINYKLNHIDFIATLDDALDPNTMILEIVQLLLPQPIHESQLAALKEILIPGLPDFEWTVEYSAYLANPDEEDLRSSLNSKLEDLFRGIFSMAEYQLS